MITYVVLVVFTLVVFLVRSARRKCPLQFANVIQPNARVQLPNIFTCRMRGIHLPNRFVDAVVLPRK
jgi:hypothetical protein